MKVLEYIQSESDRQSATLEETIGMVKAWDYIKDFHSPPELAAIRQMSYLITGNIEYRRVPAVFNQGQPAINAELIPDVMYKWEAWYMTTENVKDVLDEIIKEFLNIHPFSDGNGRVASLLYNHFNRSILDPVPLPYYFGEKDS